MKILFITQVFYPDTVSTSQHLWDLAQYLTKNGHNITVITSAYPYEEKQEKYSYYEEVKGVSIHRISQSKFGKSSPIFRVFDFFTFSVNIGLKLLSIKKKSYDLILGTTVPPLLPFQGALFSKIKKITFYYWVMDLQPELSIASNLIRKDSILAKFLTYIGNYSIKHSKKIFSLDSFMTGYLVGRGAKPKDIFTIPVWPIIDKLYNGKRIDNPFRIEHGFGNKIVVMYSGNHAFVHPLGTLLNTIKLLKDDPRFLFVFVGGGVRKKDVTEFNISHKLKNIIQLPFQPRENIHNSLGSSDIQVVIMGDNQVGFTHPNKIYGALYVGKPILYIGPRKSHVTNILSELESNITVNHNESELLVDKLLDFASLNSIEREIIGKANFEFVNSNFSAEVLKRNMLDALLIKDE